MLLVGLGRGDCRHLFLHFLLNQQTSCFVAYQITDLPCSGFEGFCTDGSECGFCHSRLGAATLNVRVTGLGLSGFRGCGDFHEIGGYHFGAA